MPMSKSLNKPFDTSNIGVTWPSIKTQFAKLQKQNVPTLYNHFPDLKQGMENEVPIDTPMGIEIEVENVNMVGGHDVTFMEGMADSNIPSSFIFRMVEDHSLRNKGYEFVSRVGFSAREVMWGVKRLLLSDNLFRYPLSTGPRTSIHIHMSVLHMTIGELKKFLLWYMILEPLFFEFAGNRNRNIFCVPLVQSACPVESMFKADSLDGVRMAWRTWSKYSALNLRPIFDIGTMEFRHHKGSVDPIEIENWIVWIDSVMSFCKGESTIQDDCNLILFHIKNGTFDQFVSNTFSVNFQGHDANTSNALWMLTDVNDIDRNTMDDETTKPPRGRKKKMPLSPEAVLEVPLNLAAGIHGNFQPWVVSTNPQPVWVTPDSVLVALTAEPESNF